MQNQQEEQMLCMQMEGPRMRSFSVGNSPAVDSCCTPHPKDSLSFENNLDNHINKSRSAGKYLKQLLHTLECKGSCLSVGCVRVAAVLKHLVDCKESRCSHPGCSTTKTLLQHKLDCKKKLQKGETCLICTIASAPESHHKSSPISPSDLPSPQSLPSPARPHLSSVVRELTYPDIIVFDEMIERRVPFQPTTSLLTSRAKTFSDSDCAANSPINTPNKKARSKSMTAAMLSLAQN